MIGIASRVVGMNPPNGIGGRRASYVTQKTAASLEDANYTYEYDNEGNLTRREAKANPAIATEYQWDHYNRLERVQHKNGSAVTASVEYAYNAQGQLVTKDLDGNQDHFVYSGDQRVLTVDDSGDIQNRYVWAPGVDQLLADEEFHATGGVQRDYWAATDHLGTVGELLESGGTIVEHRQYDSFGALDAVFDQSGSATGGQFGFPNSPQSEVGYAGTFYDEQTGFTYNRARWYSPEMNRFISEDPAQDGSNWYQYAGGNSKNFRDPTGFTPAGNPLNSVAGGFSGNVFQRENTRLRNVFDPFGHTTLAAAPRDPFFSSTLVGTSISSSAPTFSVDSFSFSDPVRPAITSVGTSSQFNLNSVARLLNEPSNPLLGPISTTQPISIPSEFEAKGVGLSTLGFLARGGKNSIERTVKGAVEAGEAFREAPIQSTFNAVTGTARGLKSLVDKAAEFTIGFAFEDIRQRNLTTIDAGIDKAIEFSNKHPNEQALLIGDGLGTTLQALTVDRFARGNGLRGTRPITGAPQNPRSPIQVELELATDFENRAAQFAANELRETVIQSQVRQGAVNRGFDFLSFTGTGRDARLFINEVKNVTGRVASSSFSTFGLGRSGVKTFREAVGFAQAAIDNAGLDNATRLTLLNQVVPGGGAAVRLIGSQAKGTVFNPFVNDLIGQTTNFITGEGFLIK